MSSHPEISKRWRDLLALIPGYDSIATAPEGYYFDGQTADNVVEFFHTYLTHTEGDLGGQPLILEPWQQAKLGAVFGWKKPNGKRRYREVFDYEPRKNGKSTFCGGLVNAMAFLDQEQGARIYAIAESRDQATLVFNQTEGQIRNNDELLSMLPEGEGSIRSSYKSIRYEKGFFKALPSEAKNQHGLNPSTVIVDELHAHRSREMLDVMLTAVAARSQPLIYIITTADYDRPSVCNQKYDYACRVRDGRISDPHFLPIIYEADRDDDWTDPAVWKKANPNLGVSVQLEFLERECQRAKDEPQYENTFRRLHLNQRTEQDERLIQIDRWDQGDEPLDINSYLGRTCYGGMDLSATSDFTSFALAFPEPDGESVAVFVWFWLPETPIRRDEGMEADIAVWTRDGFIERTPGNVVDFGHVVDRILEIRGSFDVREVGCDPWNARHAMQLLIAEGVEVVEFRQGMQSMALPTSRVMELMAGGKLKHGGNPVLRWQALNCAGERDSNNNLKFSKKKSAEKIDGMVAMTMAIGRLTITENGGDNQPATVEQLLIL